MAHQILELPCHQQTTSEENIHLKGLKHLQFQKKGPFIN